MSHPPPERFIADNPPHRWHATSVEWLEAPPRQPVDIYVDKSHRILSKNSSPDIPFTWSVNPYRGCMHACAYCYARPTHEYLDFGSGSDFDRKIVIKPDAPRLLERAFERPGWRGELVVFSGNTDCYQALEAKEQLTRQCLEVCARYRNPVAIITKSTLVERDIDLLRLLTQTAHCAVTVSIPFLDAETARGIEPGVPTPKRRLKTVAALASAGVSVGVNVAPIIPGLNDADIIPLLKAAKSAGANYAGFTLVRLPGPVAEIFPKRLRSVFPLRADKVLSQIRQCRGDALNDGRFGHRMSGSGPRWDAIASMFRQTRRRLGLEAEVPTPKESTFQRPTKRKVSAQLDLFPSDDGP